MSSVKLFVEAQFSFLKFKIDVLINLLTEHIIKNNYPDQKDKQGDRE
jgi:hypothetical protein